MRETAKPRLKAWTCAAAAALLVAGAVALVASWRPRGSAELDRLWNAASIADFESAAKQKGIESPSLHRWRAQVALERGDMATSVRELFTASAFDDSLSGRTQLLSDLAVTQEALGLTKTIFDGTLFRFVFVGAERWSLWLFAAAFWICVLLAFARWYAPNRSRGKIVPTIALASLLTLLGSVGLVVDRAAPPYAVLTGPGTVPLFRSPEALANPNDASGRLAELPAGTLVSVGETTDTGVRLVEPFGGWVAKDRSVPAEAGVRN